MRTRTRTLATIALGAVALTLLPAVIPHAADAFAQTTGGSSSSNVFSGLQSKATDLFYNARTIILIISALAIVGTMALQSEKRGSLIALPLDESALPLP